MTPMPADRALDQFFLDARSRVLDLAAALDRFDRGAGSVADDPRMKRLRQAVATLMEPTPGRAERAQQIFSLEYDPNWPRPQPKY